MKESLILLFLLVVTSPDVTPAAEQHLLLETLGANLRHARSLQTGAKTSFRCPENLEQLNGISMASVFVFLSMPDFESGNEHSYFLTSPVPSGQKGGGFPEITFVSTQSGTVERVRCSYAK